MDIHDLSFRMGVRNIDVWREQDRFTGTARGDSHMSNDVSCIPATAGWEGGLGSAEPLMTRQNKGIWLARAALPT